MQCYSSLFHFAADFAKEGREAEKRRGNLVMWHCLSGRSLLVLSRETNCLLFWVNEVGWLLWAFFLREPSSLPGLHIEIIPVLLSGIWVEEGGVCVQFQCWQEEMFSRRLTDSDLLLSLLLMSHSLSKLGIELFLQCLVLQKWSTRFNLKSNANQIFSK